MDKLTVRAWRMVRELSQEKMASLLGIHPNTYAEWEKHPENISIGNAYKICEIFDTTLDAVIFLPQQSTNM